MKHSLRHLIATAQRLISGRQRPESIEVERLDVPQADPPGSAIHLDSCQPFDRIAVRTQRTDYDVVILPGHAGEVLVRGGRYFGEFRQARLAGSTLGGSAIRANTIEVGCRLELHANGARILTSPIEAVSRGRAAAADAA
jgi:hypothetical protein